MTSAATTPSSILLATDLSCRCDRATDRAAQLAELWGAQLHVVAAVERDFREPSWSGPLAADLGAARAELEPVFAGRNINWHVSVDAGAPHEVALETAAKLGSQLIITGAARNELLGRSNPGRTVEMLAHAAPAPVLVVKRRVAGPYRRILAPTDFSLVSEQATQHVVELFPDAALTLLHAYRVPFAGFISETAHHDEMRQEAARARDGFLERVAARLGRPVNPEVLLEYGAPEHLTAEYVEAQNPDLVAVASRRRGGGPHHGGTATALLMASRCDVLLCPEPEHPGR
ncbi:universal stress protein [Phenylobacterium sp.]|uniref:universal stress protein n=1 Tax=Phenylobacterium sp. TaxID=1871053 RepID=UPI0035B08376